MDKHNEFEGIHTWKDTIGCVAVLLAIVFGTVSGAYTIYSEAAHVASLTETHSA
jgi:hypothetical protein